MRKKPRKATARRWFEFVTSPAIQIAPAPAEPTRGPAIATFASFQASCGISFKRIIAPRNGMKRGARDGQALSLGLEDVSHLVDEEEHDQADANPPASHQDVERGGDEHREEELPLEQYAAELEDERSEGEERGEELAEEREARLMANRLRRLVVGELGQAGALFWCELGHKLMVPLAPGYAFAPKVRRDRAPGAVERRSLYLRRPTRSNRPRRSSGAQSSKPSSASAGAVLVLTALAASPAGGAARRSIAAFAHERRSGERHQGVANAEGRPARPARAQREAPGVSRPTSAGARGAGRGRSGPQGQQGPVGTGRARRPDGPAGPAGPGSGEAQSTTCRRTRPPPRSSPYGGLILRAACSSAGDMKISARSTLDNARLHVAGVDDTARSTGRTTISMRAPTTTFSGRSDDDVAGTIVYRSPTGSSVVSVSFLAEEYSLAGTGRCQFAGTGVVAQ